ncbi:transcriptional regulator [Bacillus sp. MKU004]|jgi:predicted transcriptional regulator YdeE|nr:transcriptional regulator [Bacillus sp. MKU004]
MEKLDYKVTDLPGYRAIGLKWEGAYSEVAGLKEMIQKMSNRVSELEHAVNPQEQLGLSYHLRPDGFVHYSVYEVSPEQEIPAGMEEINVSPMTYFCVHHPKGKDIGHTYTAIYHWMKENGEYTPFTEAGTKYYDDLPIKHERYPYKRDLKDPHFDILIPLTKK